MKVQGVNQDSLKLAAAIELLEAKRDGDRWQYFAEETDTWWSCSKESLIKLGELLDGRMPAIDAIYQWAEADNEAHEIGRNRR